MKGSDGLAMMFSNRNFTAAASTERLKRIRAWKRKERWALLGTVGDVLPELIMT